MASRKKVPLSMFDSDPRDKPRPAQSLLSLGRTAEADDTTPHGRAKAASVVSASQAAQAAQSAADRHRLARTRREARPNALLAALAASHAAAPEPPRYDSASAPAAPAHDDSRRLQPTNADYEANDGPPAAALPPEPEFDGYEGHDVAAPRTSRDDGNWRPLLDPMKIVHGIVKSRNIILATTVAGALIGVAIALSTPKTYESVAELLVDPRDLKIVDREITSSGLPSDATLAIVENQVRVLTSGNVLEKVVDKLNLAADPEFNGEATGFSLRGMIGEIRAIFSRDDGGAGDVRRALAIRNLGEALSVERGGKTFVVSIGATTRDREKSALIANTLTDVFLQTYGDIQSGSAGRASDELTSRLVELQAGLEAAEREVEAYKAENDIADAGGRLISDDEMVKLNDQLSVARARTIELNARAASARGLDLDAVVGGELPEQVASPVMAELRSQYAVSKQEVERLSVRLGPRHPERLAAEAQLAGARDSMVSELRRITSSIQVELKRAVQLEQDLASRLAQVKARQSGVSEDLVTLRELEREAAAKRAVYESFLLRARETGEQRGMNTANMSVISVAQPPLDPLGPSRSMMVIAATMLGFVTGVGIGGVRGAVDSLRDGSGGASPRPAPRPASLRPLATRWRRDKTSRPTDRQTADDIDRIMKAAAGGPPPVATAAVKPMSAAGPLAEAPVAVQAPAAAPEASSAPPVQAAISSAPKPAEDIVARSPVTSEQSLVSTHEETAMQPLYPYPYYPAAPAQPANPAQAWYDQQAAHAHQQALQHAALQQAYAYQQQQLTQQQYAPQPAPFFGGYPQPPLYPPMQMPAPPSGAQPWPPQAQPPAQPYQTWPQPAAYPAHLPAQPRAPEPARPATQAAPAEPSPVDEIRESLREFREAVRDLSERRARGRDY